MIPIEQESKDFYKNTKVYEVCIFCRQETMYWHIETNKPVCPQCSLTHEVKDINQTSNS